jgi:Ni,Fe-hydrogenase I cytochrome b subunit
VQARERLGTYVVLATMAVTCIVLYVNNYRTQQCLSTYIARDSAATKARAEVADDERQAFKHVIEVIVEPKSTIDARRTVITDYFLLLQKDDLIRAKNPVQPVPESCS